MSGPGLWVQTSRTLEMIKVSHSVFALPFALASLVLVSGGLPDPVQLGWVILAMVAARSAAMAFNRLSDQRYDAANPRTAGRALPAGLLSRRFVILFVLVSSAVFALAAGMLNPLCLALSPVALVVILGYSLAKRFTALCHLWLGVALAISPLAAWIAVTGRVDASVWTPAWMAFCVLFWVAGFDLIYACQDVETDQRLGLHSIPSRVGQSRALAIAVAFHLLALAALVGLGLRESFGVWYWVGFAGIVLLLAVEHVLARRGPASLPIAFFHVNAAVGMVFLVGVLGDRWA